MRDSTCLAFRDVPFPFSLMRPRTGERTIVVRGSGAANGVHIHVFGVRACSMATRPGRHGFRRAASRKPFALTAVTEDLASEPGGTAIVARSSAECATVAPACFDRIEGAQSENDRIDSANEPTHQSCGRPGDRHSLDVASLRAPCFDVLFLALYFNVIRANTFYLCIARRSLPSSLLWEFVNEGSWRRVPPMAPHPLSIPSQYRETPILVSSDQVYGSATGISRWSKDAGNGRVTLTRINNNVRERAPLAQTSSER